MAVWRNVRWSRRASASVMVRPSARVVARFVLLIRATRSSSWARNLLQLVQKRRGILGRSLSLLGKDVVGNAVAELH
jgi:hypothetical protein